MIRPSAVGQDMPLSPPDERARRATRLGRQLCWPYSDVKHTDQLPALFSESSHGSVLLAFELHIAVGNSNSRAVVRVTQITLFTVQV